MMISMCCKEPVPLSSLVKKKKQEVKERLKYIKGPVSLSEHYSSKYNRHIYIFGDIHEIAPVYKSDVNIYNSFMLDDFLKSLSSLKNKDEYSKKIDYFLEVYNDPDKDVSYKGYSESIYNMYKEYNKKQQELSLFNNIRLHRSDIRCNELVTKIDMLYIFLFHIPDNLRELTKKFRYFNEVDWNFILTVADNPYKYIERIKRECKINKQLDNLQYPELKNKILSYFESKAINELKNLTSDVVITLKDIYTIKSNEEYNKLYKDIQILSVNILNTFVYLTDIYLIARMFRKFKYVKDKMSEPPQNIIVNIGNFHAENCRIFLSQLGFSTKKVESLKPNEDYQCINVSSFHQPFFSQFDLSPDKVYSN